LKYWRFQRESKSTQEEQLQTTDERTMTVKKFRNVIRPRGILVGGEAAGMEWKIRLKKERVGSRY
jgi:hypothetical protein